MTPFFSTLLLGKCSNIYKSRQNKELPCEYYPLSTIFQCIANTISFICQHMPQFLSLLYFFTKCQKLHIYLSINISACIHKIQKWIKTMTIMFRWPFFNWRIIYTQWNAQILNVSLNQYWKTHALVWSTPSWRYRTFSSFQKVLLCPS